MTEAAESRWRGRYSNLAIAASVVTATALAPFLFFACTSPVASSSVPQIKLFELVINAFSDTGRAIVAAPQVFGALLATALAAGALLALLRLRHVVIYAAVGAMVSFGFSFLAPIMINAWETFQLARELDSLGQPPVIAMLLLAGALDGVAFWFMAELIDAHGNRARHDQR